MDNTFVYLIGTFCVIENGTVKTLIQTIGLIESGKN